MTTPKNDQKQRRSLLRRVRGTDTQRQMPLWRSLIIANALVALLTLIANVATTRSLERAPQVLLITIIFCTPITVLAYYGSVLAGRIRNRQMRMMFFATAWLVSGLVGTFVAFSMLNLISGQGMPSLDGVRSLPLGNGLIAVVIGGMVFTVELMRHHYRQRSQLLRQQDQLTAELQAARNMQQSLLPPQGIRVSGFDISGMTEPAVEIGGDYFDYLTFADGTKGIIVADAAGKGVPAALLMSKFQGMAQALSIHVPCGPEFFIGLNDTLTIRLDRRSFITVGMLTIDYEDRCTFYRAGHNPLLVYRSATGTVETLRPAGVALGLTHGPINRIPIIPASFAMDTGDVALLFSDGLTEATDGTEEAFGDERTADALQRAGALALDAAAARDAIMQCLADFVGGAEPHDDITLVVVRKV